MTSPPQCIRHANFAPWYFLSPTPNSDKLSDGSNGSPFLPLPHSCKTSIMNPPGQVHRHPQSHLISEADTLYEQEIARNPGSVKPWIEYVNFKRKHATPYRQAFVLERACSTLPRSYKLWKMYLELRMEHVANMNPAQHAV